MLCQLLATRYHSTTAARISTDMARHKSASLFSKLQNGHEWNSIFSILTLNSAIYNKCGEHKILSLELMPLSPIEAVLLKSDDK